MLWWTLFSTGRTKIDIGFRLGRRTFIAFILHGNMSDWSILLVLWLFFRYNFWRLWREAFMLSLNLLFIFLGDSHSFGLFNLSRIKRVEIIDISWIRLHFLLNYVFRTSLSVRMVNFWLILQFFGIILKCILTKWYSSIHFRFIAWLIRLDIRIFL